MHRILIVDEDEHLLWALEKNLFPERDDLEVITATEGQAGMDFLKEGDIDLLVSDIKMPGKVDGFQLILRAKEIAPDARVVIMTAFGSGRIESFADRMGITHYIEKPFNISELRDMALDLLDEKEGFQGMLSDLELTDIIQMLCLAKRTTLLHLKHKDHRGKIVFDRGDLVHAEFGEHEGVEAVYQMLALRQGDIFMESDVDYDERTINVGWQDLLLEAMKRADEQRLAEESAAEDASDGTPFSSFRPSESAEIDLDQVAADASNDESLEENSHTDRLTGDSFFTDEELEEIGMASSEAIEQSGVFDSDADAEASEEPAEASHSDVDSEANEDSEAHADDAEADSEEEAESETEADDREVSNQQAEGEDFTDQRRQTQKLSDAELASDGGHTLAEESSGAEALSDVSEETVASLLEEFSVDCPRPRLTGVVGPGRSDGAAFIEAGPAEGHEPGPIAAKMLEIVDCAARVASTAKDELEATEVQLTLPDGYVVVRRIERTDQHHFVVVDRDASLGVVLVLMRQLAERLARAVNLDS